MARYFTDFRENSIASGTPAGWTARYATTGYTRAIEADESGYNESGKRLRLTATATAAKMLSLNALDADPNRATIQVRMLARQRLQSDSSANALGGLAARASGASGSEASVGVIFGIGSTPFREELRLVKSVAGTRTYTAGALGSDVWITSGYYWLTLTASGTTVDVSIAGVSTPDTPIVSAQITDAADVAGWVGVWLFGSITDMDVLAFSVGTNGDSASLTPVAPAAAPAIGTITPSGTSASVAFTGLDPYATGLEYRLDGGSWVSAGSTTSPITVSGLTESTEYDIELRATNAAGGSAASTLATFTTTAGTVVKGVREILYNGATAVGAITGITALWWDATTPSGAPDYETTTAATNGSGEMALDLDAVTTLNLDDPGFLLVYKLDATDHEDSLAFAGRFMVKDIG